MSLTPLTMPMEHQRDDMDRIVLLREMLDTPPFLALINLMNELLAEDSMPYDITWAYHDLAGAVMRSGLPRVTGDRWRDFILWGVLRAEHPFARAALRGSADDVMVEVMRCDLKFMQSLFLLDDAMVRNWCQTAKPVNTVGWTSWSAHAAHAPEGSDPLSKMQRALIFSEDWAGLCGMLQTFFKENGTGIFHDTRTFVYDGTELRPARASQAAEAYDAGAFAAYMGQTKGSIYVKGDIYAAVEAVRQAACQADIRLVEVWEDASARMDKLLDALSVQPYSFALLLRGASTAEALRRFLDGKALDKPPPNIVSVFLPPLPEPLPQGCNIYSI